MKGHDKMKTIGETKKNLKKQLITAALLSAASYFGYQKYGKILTAVSLTLGIFTVLFLAMHREPYAASISFLLFVLKVILVMKHEKINR